MCSVRRTVGLDDLKGLSSNINDSKTSILLKNALKTFFFFLKGK